MIILDVYSFWVKCIWAQLDASSSKILKELAMSESITPIVTVSFFHYRGGWCKWQGFRNMGLVPPLLKRVDGLNFSKMLGSGLMRLFPVRFFLLQRKGKKSSMHLQNQTVSVSVAEEL